MNARSRSIYSGMQPEPTKKQARKVKKVSPSQVLE